VTVLAAIAFPQLDPVAIRLGPLAVRWYGLAYVTGFVVAGFVLWWLARRWKLGLTGDDAVTIVLAAVIGVVIGGRVGYFLFYGGSAMWSDPFSVLRIWDGGMSFHGGLAGILIAGVVAARVLDMPWLTICDLGTVGAPVGLFFGRLANFVNAELWGRTTDVPWAVVFPNAGTAGRHPSQLYEAGLEGLLLFAVLFWLAMRVPPRPRGIIFGVFLAGYALARILVEFFREPDAQLGFIAGGVTMGQLLSLPVLAVGIWLVWWSARRGLPQLGPQR